MKIIFFGSDSFACAYLEYLGAASACEIVCCVTQPDRPQDRGMKVKEPPIKAYARAHGIEVLQPTKLDDAAVVSALQRHGADVFVVIAYGRILPAGVLGIPRLGSVNVHGSLLPKYRGAAPINWAIINGEKESGVSIIQMNPQMDAGDILAQYVIPIEPADTAVTLRAKMIHQGPPVLLATLVSVREGRCRSQEQNSSQVTYAPKLTKELGAIQWQMPARAIDDRVRGLLPWPGAYTLYRGKILKVLASAVLPLSSEQRAAAGEIVAVTKEGIVVACGDGRGIQITEVLPEASKPMSAYQFVVGHHLKEHERFPS